MSRCCIKVSFALDEMASMVSSRTTGTLEVESISWILPQTDGVEFHIEYSAARFIRLMGKIEDIMCAHKTFANHTALLGSILGHRKDPFHFEGPALTFGTLEIDTSFFEENWRRWYPKGWQQCSLNMTQPPRVANQCVLF